MKKATIALMVALAVSGCSQVVVEDGAAAQYS
jgi:uncharacterized protein YceK